MAQAIVPRKMTIAPRKNYNSSTKFQVESTTSVFIGVGKRKGTTDPRWPRKLPSYNLVALNVRRP